MDKREEKKKVSLVSKARQVACLCHCIKTLLLMFVTSHQHLLENRNKHC